MAAIRLLVVSGHLIADPDLPDGAKFLRKPYASDGIVATLIELAA